MSEHKHGGARAGAGRKPKAYHYAALTNDLEQKVADALPSIVDALIESAQNGDLGAAKYLCDRILGRVGVASSPPAYDQSVPMSEQDYDCLVASAEKGRELDRLMTW